MPDASKAARRFDADFQPTHQLMPWPDVPAPRSPLLDIDIFREPAPPAPAPMPFPDTTRLERERKDRLARAALRERMEIERRAATERLIERALDKGYATGHKAGRRSGYTAGWWWGAGYGVMAGCALMFGAIKLGLALGVA